MYPVLEIHIVVFPKGTPLLNWYNYTDNLPGIRLLYTYMYVFVTWWRICGITLCIDVAIFFCCIFGALSIKNDLLQKITIMQARVQRLLHKKVSVHHFLLLFSIYSKLFKFLNPSPFEWRCNVWKYRCYSNIFWGGHMFYIFILQTPPSTLLTPAVLKLSKDT